MSDLAASSGVQKVKWADGWRSSSSEVIAGPRTTM
jgi:hypothetical protein